MEEPHDKENPTPLEARCAMTVKAASLGMGGIGKQTKCVWESHYDAQVKKNFHYRAQHRLSYMMSTLRRKHVKKPEWIPKWIGVDGWPRLLDHWATDPTFQKHSQIGKVNRASEKGGCLQSGGSKRFDERTKEVLSQSDGSSLTGTKHLLDHSTTQTIWKETVEHERSDKYCGAETMSSNLIHNRCIYERSIDGEGGSRNVEMTPEMVTLIQQLSQQMQTQNQVELEQARTQSRKELEEMRTQVWRSLSTPSLKARCAMLPL
ncbi:hypothetical protein MTR_2g077640 [Medicago truncatula]|uniref:Transposase, Ptta/En/Spm, plant n=1 Tax=Medicago truncatula TaxID=3880 RepID=G7IJI2_MEDTR|nr:hypothetical protein MTR_2g077640 [Medicago truncatula]